MQCPKCKKIKTKIESELYESSYNSIKRQRSCSCGYLFVSYEINKEELKHKSLKILKHSNIVKKRRKQTPKEEWIDFKIFFYGFLRYAVLSKAVKWAEGKFKEEKFEVDGTFLGAVKGKNRKSYFQIFNKEKKYKEYKFERVKQTIERCVSSSFYWKKKKFYNKKLHIPDERNKRLINDEIIELNRSVTSYVRRSKYNLDFYRNNKHFDDLIKHINSLEKSSKTKINLKDKSILENFKKLWFWEWYWKWYEEIR